MLFPSNLQIKTVENWGCIYTKNRCEKQVFQKLALKEVPIFLPTIIQQKNYQSCIRKHELPLFPGYLFYDSEVIRRGEIISIKHVVQVYPLKDPEKFRTELANLENALIKDPNSWKEIDNNISGTPVIIVAGSLKGVTGEFVKRESNSAFIIRITLLGRSIETSIDAVHVNPL